MMYIDQYMFIEREIYIYSSLSFVYLSFSFAHRILRELCQVSRFIHQGSEV